ncbi:exodeoxyribonuclease V subunit beta [Escherichia coli]|uniref:exodeoxyribonuclease V subunit beta n=1 Tax=Escherichia coli TaxID=562 RepID=UPI00044F174C|nr:exodeoxyribonuclease V subunit beta [Escherichia coli]EFK0530102.1 exodeoxyribonuclease V subunit beta [Escherichia coli]EZH11677.1 exodeoxyribonuclease V subunit beta [Escherichia coli O26:H11 str. 2009C-3689]
MALSPKEKKELQQRFEKQLLPDWGGYQDAEEWEKYGKHQETELPEYPEPVEGWCDCDKCKSMIFHKEKNIYVCLSCHKQTEPFLPIDWNSNDYDWLPYEDEY